MDKLPNYDDFAARRRLRYLFSSAIRELKYELREIGDLIADREWLLLMLCLAVLPLWLCWVVVWLGIRAISLYWRRKHPSVEEQMWDGISEKAVHRVFRAVPAKPNPTNPSD